MPPSSAGISEHDSLDKSIAALNWDDCTRKVDVTNPESLNRLAELFKRSDHFVHRFPNAAAKKKRDKFVGTLLTALESAGLTESRDEICRRVDEGALFEKCLHELLSTLPKTAPGRLPPEHHVWALIQRLAEEDEYIESETLRTIRNSPEPFNPATISTVSEDGTSYHPDDMLCKLSEIVASSIIMLSINNNWLSSDGRVTLPPPVLISKDDIYAVGITEYMGHCFQSLSHLIEKWRFWGGSVREAVTTIIDLDGNERDIKCVIYEPEFTSAELYDHVATERLDRYVGQNMLSLEFEGPIEHRVPDFGKPVDPAPGQYVSKKEAQAAAILSSLVSFNVLKDASSYGGLKFSDWLRGYAWLQRRGEHSKTIIDQCAEDTAIQELMQVGVREQTARKFIRLISLERGRSDLFDTPLIATKDGNLYYHPSMVKKLNIPRVIMSRLSTIGAVINRKGTAFEKETLRQLNDAKLGAKSFTFHRDGETYQYDAVFMWENALFVIECKNYSLPLVSPMQLFWFMEKMSDAIDQVNRLADAANRFPDEIRSRLDINNTWETVIPCVLNALPWSVGKTDQGTYILDASSVGRFFQHRTFFVNIPIQIEDTTVLVRHHLKEFWPQSGPTVKHFLDEMEQPWQLKSLIQSFQVHQDELVLSENLAFRGAFLRKISSSMIQELAAIGIPDPSRDLDEIFERLAHARDEQENRRNGSVNNDNKSKKRPGGSPDK